jgi:hypothetical protein
MCASESTDGSAGNTVAAHRIARLRRQLDDHLGAVAREYSTESRSVANNSGEGDSIDEGDVTGKTLKGEHGLHR